MSDDRNLLQALGVAPTEGISSASKYALDYDWNGMYNATSQSNDNVIESWWNSSNTADRDFSRQMLAQQYQNDYESAPNQMALAKEAGINLNTAAGQILNGSAPSMSAPSTDAPEPLSGAASALGAVAGVPEQMANASNLSADAFRTRLLMRDELANLKANTALSLEGIGLSRAQTNSLLIQNKYLGQNLALDIARKSLELPILREQYNVLQANYDYTMQGIEKMKSDIKLNQRSMSLMELQEATEKARKAEAQANADFVHQKFVLLRDFGWDTSTGFAGLAAGIAFNNAKSIEDGQNMFSSILMSLDDFNTASNLFVMQKQLDNKIEELSKSEQVRKSLAKYGVKTEFTRMVLRDAVKYLFGTGISVNVGKVGVQNAPGE